MSQTAFTLAEPAAEDAVTDLRRRFPNLPAEYFSFLLGSNGGEGFLGISPGYAVLWGAQEVAQFSSEYEVQIYLPGYVAVGTSGGGRPFRVSSFGLACGHLRSAGDRHGAGCCRPRRAIFFGIRRCFRRKLAATCLTGRSTSTRSSQSATYSNGQAAGLPSNRLVALGANNSLKPESVGVAAPNAGALQPHRPPRHVRRETTPDDCFRPEAVIVFRTWLGSVPMSPRPSTAGAVRDDHQLASRGVAAALFGSLTISSDGAATPGE